MKKIEKLAAAFTGIGLLGILVFAESIGTGLVPFLKYEAPFFALLILGAVLSNTKAGAEAPATNTMNREITRNS